MKFCQGSTEALNPKRVTLSSNFTISRKGKPFTSYLTFDFPSIFLFYNDLIAYVKPILLKVYERVEVPLPAPEKRDFGDADFLVAGVKSLNNPNCSGEKGLLSAKDVIRMQDGSGHGLIQKVSEERTMALLGAHSFVRGVPTSNFAIPQQVLHEFKEQWEHAWDEKGLMEEEREQGPERTLERRLDPNGQLVPRIEKQRQRNSKSNQYYQVDIHVCHIEHLDAEVFCHSYGDLMMILGSLSSCLGLSLGSKGLRIRCPGLPPFLLTTSILEILRFFGYISPDDDEPTFFSQSGSKSTYISNPLLSSIPYFPTENSIFEWVSKSPFFCPIAILKLHHEDPSYPASSKVIPPPSHNDGGKPNRKFRTRAARPMYGRFKVFCSELVSNATAHECPCLLCRKLPLFSASPSKPNETVQDSQALVDEKRKKKARNMALERWGKAQEWKEAHTELEKRNKTSKERKKEQ